MPVGATSVLDFVNGFYYAGGASQPISSLLGGGFDPSAISGSGMYIDYGNANRPTPIGSFLSDLIAGAAAGMTVLFDFATSGGTNGFLLYLGDTVFQDVSSTWMNLIEAGSVNDENSVSIFSAVPDTGSNKVAVTYNRSAGGGNYEFAISVNGAAAVTQTVGYVASAVVHAQLGWSGFEGDGLNLFNTYIKSITLYQAKLSADLPELTGL